jgi:hypothetical protein
MSEREKHPGGRPSIYSVELAQTICLRLMQGESLTHICKDPEMPEISTVYRWLNPAFEQYREEFFNKYTCAREVQADVLVDQMLDIGDDRHNDVVPKYDAQGNAIGYEVDYEHIQRSKLKCENRRWVAERILPRRWGNRQSLEVSVHDFSQLLEAARERVQKRRRENSDHPG